MEKSFLFYLRTNEHLVLSSLIEDEKQQQQRARGFVPIIIIIALNSSGLKKYSYIQSK